MSLGVKAIRGLKNLNNYPYYFGGFLKVIHNMPQFPILIIKAPILMLLGAFGVLGLGVLPSKAV